MLLGQTLKAQHTVKVYGTITNPKENVVKIKYYKDYISFDEALADSATLDAAGNFSMEFSWEKSYPATFYHGEEISNMFLSPGDHLKLNLDTEMFDETLVYEGTGSIVNNYLAQKMLLFPGADQALFKSNETEFIRRVDEAHAEELGFFQEYFSKIKDGDSSILAFKKMEQADIHYSWLSQKNLYPSYHQYLNKGKAPELSTGYYKYLDGIDVYLNPVMTSYAYQDFLSNYVEAEVEKIFAKDTTQNRMAVKELYISSLGLEVSEFILAKWVYTLLTEENDITNGKTLFDQFNLYYPDSRYRELLLNTVTITTALQPGNVAPLFTLPDTSGNFVSLKSFQGKIVYLDIWASWCGPCRTEIPFSHKLQEEMAEKDVVFLFVSIDDDEMAWKRMIKEKNMTGIHLISAGEFDSDVAQQYNVRGIPHYVIIGKDGNILDINAKRPSGDVKGDLEKYLE